MIKQGLHHSEGGASTEDSLTRSLQAKPNFSDLVNVKSWARREPGIYKGHLTSSKSHERRMIRGTGSSDFFG